MANAENRTPQEAPLDTIQKLLARSATAGETLVDLTASQNGLLQQSAQTGDNLLEFTSSTAHNTERQTLMAQERTALTREQTRLSTRATELANIRTDLAHERTTLAGQRTDLAVGRTELARRRTSLAEGRTGMAQMRTRLAEERTGFAKTRTGMAEQRTALASTRTDLSRERSQLANERTGYSVRRTELAQDRNSLATVRTLRAQARTRLSWQRTELARERTHLAFVRTGLALLTFGVVLFRYFGVSWWSIFDAVLVLGSSALVAAGTSGYFKAHRRVRTLENLLTTDEGMRDLGPTRASCPVRGRPCARTPRSRHHAADRERSPPRWTSRCSPPPANRPTHRPQDAAPRTIARPPTQPSGSGARSTRCSRAAA